MRNDEVRTIDWNTAHAFNMAYDTLKGGNDIFVEGLLGDEHTQLDVLEALDRNQESWLTRIAKVLRPTKVLSSELELVRLGGMLAESRKSSLIDPVTGIYNRSFFDTYLAKELMRTGRQKIENGNNGIALLILDLDNFKTVNDTNGHQVGDEILQIVASSLTVRGEDVASRIGGDEFAVVMPTNQFAQLQEKLFGKDDFTGANTGTLLREINDSIYEKLSTRFEEPDKVWPPVMCNGVRTYFSPGISFVASGILAGYRNGESLDIMTKTLIRLSDQASSDAKKYRKAGRKV